MIQMMSIIQNYVCFVQQDCRILQIIGEMKEIQILNKLSFFITSIIYYYI